MLRAPATIKVFPFYGVISKARVRFFPPSSLPRDNSISKMKRLETRCGTGLSRPDISSPSGFLFSGISYGEISFANCILSAFAPAARASLSFFPTFPRDKLNNSDQSAV